MLIDFNRLEGLSLLAALAVALAVLVAAEPLGRLLRVIDHPDDGRKTHAQATPLIGGLAIMLPLILWAVGALVWPRLVDGQSIPAAILVCGGGAALIGFLDDRSSTSPALRLAALLALTVAALIVSPQLLPAKFVWGHLAPTRVAPWLSYILVAIGMTGFVNSVNMADGQDGCVAGMFAIWSACIIVSGGGSTDDLAAVLLATSLAVLAFNLRGKVFLGGAGAYGVTFVFGLLILDLHNAWEVTAETIIVWFFIPIVDCLRLMIQRPLQGRSPFEADRNHLHHRLQERFGKTAGLGVYLGLVGSTSLLAALSYQLAPACLAILSCAYLGLMLITTREADRAVAPAKIVRRD
ncbi:MAG TPA: MraY family glycosyltransferase [Rhizomicrobium sp.]|nr:MraY family glycosyltransferase [Rhizomicrobium sp.]